MSIKDALQALRGNLALDEEEPRRLTGENFQRGAGLAWTPDGNEIIFSAGRFKHHRLWKVSLPDGKLVSLTGQESLSREYPALSPSGDGLAYTEIVPNQGDIWRVRNPGVDGPKEAPRRLVATSQDEFFPSLSEDGSRLVFVTDRTGHCNSTGWLSCERGL